MTFFNIFSKTKEQKSSKQKKIIVDHREKNSLVVSYLIQHGFAIEYAQLPVADYLVHDVAIERKTVADFKSSIINKRIMKQLFDLKQYKKHALILEGINESMYEGILHENAFRGFLLSVIMNYQVPIIYTKSAEDTAKYIAVLAKKSPKKDMSLRAVSYVRNKEEQLQFILEGFPGIGPVTAKKLLMKFKNVQSIIGAKDEELKALIGKKAESIITLRKHTYLI